MGDKLREAVEWVIRDMSAEVPEPASAIVQLWHNRLKEGLNTRVVLGGCGTCGSSEWHIRPYPSSVGASVSLWIISCHEGHPLITTGITEYAVLLDP